MPFGERRAWLGPALAVGFQLLTSLAFLTKPIHLDETLYLRIAGQVLKEPARPLGFDLYWFGRTIPASLAHPNPPTIGYLLAPSAAAAGGGVAAMRLAALPFELLAALFLYLLAAKFLARPLLPVLAVLAGPGWWITIHELHLEKFMAAFGFASLYFLSLADPRRPDRWWWAAAACAGAAGATKYPAAIFPLAGAVWLAARGAPLFRAAVWLAAACAPMGALLAWQALDPERLRFVAAHSTGSQGTGPAHHARAVFTFLAGCAPGAMLWAWWSGCSRRVLAAAAAAAALLFLPFLDLAPATAADRALGLVLGPAGAAALAAAAFSARASGGGLPWGALGGAALLLQAFAYWSVVARFTTFLSAAVAILLAERLERTLAPGHADRLAAAGFALSLLTGAAAAATDAAFARAGRHAAEELAAPALAAGRRVWFTGHWGFQHYVEAAGARPLEGWGEARAGDLALVPGLNTNVRRPDRPLKADVRVAEPPSPTGLLLMCGKGWACQAGFHSSLYGFLPFSLSREPLDRFEAIELK